MGRPLFDGVLDLIGNAHSALGCEIHLACDVMRSGHRRIIGSRPLPYYAHIASRQVLHSMLLDKAAIQSVGDCCFAI